MLYWHQTFIGFFASFVETGVDTFLFSSLIFLKYQLAILGYRLSQIGQSTGKSNKPNNRENVLDCIRMHIEIKE